ncbi:hypothetical protein [Streptococcus acidominimus]|uniref:Uncharacterized protein n=1 Tax=Streptococcus acidominimus TaxID=1326 RepID=A0A4Y9FNX4_STRAI|nr:hypothetical protein [Streptococcus acidominimus]MBF0818693.1 hypothetical protein [Streptococcus acidominimus]MBF0838364.1 hypothetical protein [Streptococcus acidominimus]MBF0847320.1 hypothetical protein [Streptococcus danieliae]TFU30861.1 hypothetical protein E4U01_04385 [Streptococcus acidominimus]
MMKEKVMRWQAGLLDTIIVSVMVVFGLVTLLGGVYGLLSAFVYLAPLSDGKWRVMRNKKVILVCVGTQLLVYALLLILFLNLQLLPVLPKALVVVISFLLTVLGVVSFSLLTIAIWQLARGHDPSRLLLYQGVQGFILGVPYWIGLFILLLAVILAVMAYPPCLVVVVGAFLQLLNKTSEQLMLGRREP